MTSVNMSLFAGFVFIQGGLAKMYSAAYIGGYGQGVSRYHVQEISSCEQITYDPNSEENKILIKNDSDGDLTMVFVEFIGRNNFAVDIQ